MLKISKRTMIVFAVVTVAAAMMLTSGCNEKETMKTLKKYDNSHFYNNEGVFDQDAAKAAYYEMMEFYGYPVVDRLKGEEFWAIDFGLGNFTEVGMAGIFWVNNEEDNYFGHEIYLLPGQMIPEHWHMKTEKAGPKLEAWQLRHGSVTLYGEGQPSEGVENRIPPIHKDIAVARTETVLKPGEVGQLNGAAKKHWMLAGTEGTIVTEYATFHDGDGLRFTHPDIKF